MQIRVSSKTSKRIQVKSQQFCCTLFFLQKKIECFKQNCEYIRISRITTCKIIKIYTIIQDYNSMIFIPIWNVYIYIFVPCWGLGIGSNTCRGRVALISIGNFILYTCQSFVHLLTLKLQRVCIVCVCVLSKSFFSTSCLQSSQFTIVL